MGKTTLSTSIEINNIDMPTKPEVIINGQTEYIGYETSHQLHILSCITREISLDSSQKLHIVWQLIKGAARALADTEFPTLVHFAIAREALSEEKVNVDRSSKEYKELVIQVATLLHEHCQKLKIGLSEPPSVTVLLDEINTSILKEMEKEATLGILDLSDLIPTIDSLYEEKNKIFLADNVFLKHLKTIGKTSRDIADDLRVNFLNNFEYFKNLGKYPSDFWFNPNPTPEKPIFFSFAWIFLAKALWRDIVSRRADLITKGVPALVEHDQKYIISILSREKTIEETEKQIKVFSNGSLLAEIPMIPEGTIGAILNGIKKMGLVEGHRVLRYVPRTAFNQAITGHTDHRVITRESFRDIASEIGIKGERSVRDMIDVFQAMAYFEFKKPSFSGNLIALKRFKSSKTHRLDGVEITVGTILLPHRASEEFKSGESKLMIPILSDPILVGSNQYHAGQYLFQMLVMGEFVRQSVDFAKHGCIKMSEECWNKIAQESGVLQILNKIIERWTQDNMDGPQFLQKVDKDFYTLGPSYQREIDFLIRQGNHRINQSNRALNRKR